MSDLFPPLPDKSYEIIYVDPPWDYENQQYHVSGSITSAKDHYDSVSFYNLKKLNVPSISAENCLLFLWVTNPILDDGILLGRHWGFEYKTVAFVWDKDRINTGYYTLSQIELCLVFKKGNIPKPRGSRRERQLIRSKMQAHSKKPDDVRFRINRMFPTQDKIELFARSNVNEEDKWVFDGWDLWGLEA